MVHIMETLRRMGLRLNCRQSRVFYDLCYEKIKVEELTSGQIKDVLYILETRNRIPNDNINHSANVAYVKPMYVEGEGKESFNRRYIKEMLEYIKDPDNSKWKIPKT